MTQENKKFINKLSAHLAAQALQTYYFIQFGMHTNLDTFAFETIDGGTICLSVFPDDYNVIIEDAPQGYVYSTIEKRQLYNDSLGSFNVVRFSFEY